MFRRLLHLRLLRACRRLPTYSTPSKHQQYVKIPLGLLAGSLSLGVASTFFYQKSECLSSDEAEKQTVPRRLQRFLSFASAEFDGTVYMTPQDLLDSLVLDQPRERVFRNVLHANQVDKFLRLTPTLKKADKTLFRKLGHDGIISYSEYLFLLTLLTKSQSSFRIAFEIFDDDSNRRIDKHEFLKIRSLITCGFNDSMELVYSDFEQLSTSKPKSPNISELHKEMKTAVSLPENKKRPETTILVHLFGPRGQNSFQFYQNLQNELVEIEFNEFARGKNDITLVDFTRLIFRYTTIKLDDQSTYIQRVNERMSDDEQGISKQQFEQFSRFLNNLSDFSRAVKLYINANIPVSQSEFIRAVKCSTGLVLDEHLVNVLFIIFDKNNDGQLQYSEFLAIMNDRVNRGFKNQQKISGTGWKSFKRCLLNEVFIK
ncbi:EF-hand domain-containing protein [Aphelenchoides bicaudatus]|nr:EF-hand domain-containing protein [Aphelenchoides bicaudatus]